MSEILSRVDEIIKPSIRNSIQNDIDRIKQNFQLIKLDDKAELPFELDELEYEYNGVTTTEVLRGIGLK